MSNRIEKAAVTRKKNTTDRDAHIRARYHELHEQQRLRHDDCIQKIAQELFIAPSVVERVIWKPQ